MFKNDITMYQEAEYLQLSGIQHFAFCRRQWALIHIEQQWADNLRTVQGEIMHQRAHDSAVYNDSGDLITVRGLRISSSTLGVSGMCDVVEFHRCDDGTALSGHDGYWRPYPIEYKRGKPKDHDADELQLCAQSLCLEEMFYCNIQEGSLFYGETRRRNVVELTPELRDRVFSMLEEMHQLFRRGHTPKVKPAKSCNACSLNEVCIPKICKSISAVSYVQAHIQEKDQ